MTPERKMKINQVLDKRQNGMVVVLENVGDPHNISAVMRSCDAVGVQDVYVLNTVQPKYDYYSHQSSASARKWVSTHDYDSVENCIKSLKKRNLSILTSHLGAEENSIYDVDFTGDIALVFGNEKDGISDELLKYSDQNFVIPQVGMVKSLNISVACAVALYEAFRQRQKAGLYNTPSLEPHRHNELSQKWSENRKERRGGKKR